jgi:hypothetical protein
MNKQQDHGLGNPGTLLRGNQASAIAGQGNSMLSSLLGSGALGQLAGVVANFAGISRGNSSTLLGMLAPIVLGVIRRKVIDGGMNAGSLASLFTEQKDNINAAMPQGFSDQLQSAGFFDSISPETPSVVSTPEAHKTPAHASTPAPAAASGGGLMKWLLPLAAVVVLGWLGMKFLGNEAATDAVDSATGVASEASSAVSAVSAEALQAAQDAMPAGVDLSKITNSLEGVFGSTTDALTGITDVQSARAALPAIETASSTLGGLNDVITRLPDAAKGPVGAIVNNGLAALQPLIAKVTAIPGVGDLVQPVVGPMLEMLRGLAG